jgi:hypothetical protein
MKSASQRTKIRKSRKQKRINRNRKKYLPKEPNLTKGERKKLKVRSHSVGSK